MLLDAHVGFDFIESFGESTVGSPAPGGQSSQQAGDEARCLKFRAMSVRQNCEGDAPSDQSEPKQEGGKRETVKVLVANHDFPVPS